MIKRVAFVLTHALAMLQSRIKHEHSTDGSVVRKNPKHLALVIVIEVKEAVPGQDTIKAPMEC
jgi:hypothetical protein